MNQNRPMLPDFLIDRLRRREKPVAYEQPRLELPLPFVPPTRVRQEDEDDCGRGVCIIDLGA